MGLNLLHLNQCCIEFFNETECITSGSLVVRRCKSCKTRLILGHHFLICRKTTGRNYHCLCADLVCFSFMLDFYSACFSVITLEDVNDLVVRADFSTLFQSRFIKMRDKMRTDCGTALRSVDSFVRCTAENSDVAQICTDKIRFKPVYHGR